LSLSSFLNFGYIAASKIDKMFSKENYTWMLFGLVIIAIGMFLMSGGKSNNDPAVFDKDAVYSTTRITIAPILILAGLVIEMVAIFRKPKDKATS